MAHSEGPSPPSAGDLPVDPQENTIQSEDPAPTTTEVTQPGDHKDDDQHSSEQDGQEEGEEDGETSSPDQQSENGHQEEEHEAASENPQDDAEQPSPHSAPPIQVESPPENESTVGESSASASNHAPRSRSDSQSTAATTETQQTGPRSSLVFVVSALELINNSKDAQKRAELKISAQKALDEIKAKRDPQSIDPKILFEPLRMATEAATENVVRAALDCIGKLISYSYFSQPSELRAGSEEEPLIDQAIDAICDCFEGETTSDNIQLQITISLLAAVLNDKVVVHGAGLLKAVRQMYNIFLHSKNTRSQQVAQGTLTQMIGTVFERARTRASAKEARIHLSKLSVGGKNSSQADKLNDSGSISRNFSGSIETPEEVAEDPSDVPVEKDEGGKITLQTFERRGSFDEERLKEGPTMVTRAKSKQDRDESPHGDDQDDRLSEEEEEDEIYLKDAFLVFRAMCKISIKSLRPEEIADVRSQGMRAKLLSLHMIHTILFNNISLFLSPFATIRNSANNDATPFIQAVKQLLCQSLSRNGASSVNRVFEVAAEIFWLMLKHLRVLLKKEVEVFLKEIYYSILENRNAPIFQKQCFLNVMERLAQDPRALVEIYLNYDCDRTAADNMFQRGIEHVARIASGPVAITSIQQHAYQNHTQKKLALADWQLRGSVPPSLTTAAVISKDEIEPGYPPEYALKQHALEVMVELLRGLIHWAQQGMITSQAITDVDREVSIDTSRESVDMRSVSGSSPFVGGIATPPPGTPLAEDDPNQLERAKQRKTAMINAVRQFNFKPKKGIKALLEGGFIPSRSPEDIAQFLLANDQLDKAAIGEFLGEGEAENIAILHAFVDSMDFTRTRFVDALRRFLQSFRLPGEAQKIDRFMLKFAERYMTGNPNAFASADTAYVLSFSVIMLNTDQHSSKIKGPRMTPEDFIKNNRGINDNADLPEEYLRGIYDEIAHNEIVLDTERERAADMGFSAQPSTGFASGIGQAFSNVGRDLQREAYIARSEEMANKTEQLFKSLLRAQKKGGSKTSISKFIPATSYKHVGPMFEVTWMPFLTALSGCAQDTNNLETVKTCMEGLKMAIQIACIFDLESPRQAFVSSMTRFTNLYNLSEMQAKNVEALRVLLDVAHDQGNALKESWRDILTTISQLDRFQLISEGVSEKAIPDVLRAQPSSHSRGKSNARNLNVPPRSRSGSHSPSTSFRAEVAEESRSANIVNAVDRIFINSGRLTGEAIVYFVRALTQVSWQEIQSSGQSQDPRTYSLQKLVEVSEHNMSRVRFEWTNIWAVLGEHFIQVGCHANTRVVHFALNSLRQLSMRFLDLEELPGFKFQKDFLKPFEHIISNSSVVQVKEIVLHSLIQMIQARGENIRSGWRTIFGVFTVAAKERFEGVVNLAYDNVIQIFNGRLGVVIQQGAFSDLIVCLTEFSKNALFQKKSLQAIEALKSVIPKILKTPECPISTTQQTSTIKQPTKQTQEEQFWFPVLFAFHDVLMTGEDLEVRSRALNYLFDSLIKYGKSFPREFWDTIWRQLLYPIFMVLKSKSEMTKVVNHEELSVWLSTTMIQALRNMMSLFTHYFDPLEYMLDRFLDLLALCICQENDTLARIGSNCLQTLILQNVNKFSPNHWSKIVSCFVELFNRTEATSLFSAAASGYGTLPSSMANGATTPTTPHKDGSNVNELQLSDQHAERRPSRGTSNGTRPALRSPSNTSRVNGESAIETPSEPPTPGLEEFKPEQQHQAPVVVTAARRRFFNQIITKCVLQLLMIETVNELFTNDQVYARIPSPELLRLMGLLKKSYHFAKRFNDDIELRNRLFQEGFMKQPPNLLKQESGSASVYVNILFRMYHDEGEERRASRDQTEDALIPLCADIIESYLQLREETQQRNIVTWRPVVVDVIEGYANFPSEGFAKHAGTFAPLMTALMGRDMGFELQRAVQSLVHRILELHYEMPALEHPSLNTPVSPRPTVFGSRRQSRRASVNSAQQA